MCIHCAQNEANMAIGLDLGTCNVRAAVWHDSRVEAIPNDCGQLSTPASVAFLESGERLVGCAAEVDTDRFTRETVRYATRLLALPRASLAAWPISCSPTGPARVRVEYSDQTQSYTSDQIVAILLDYMRQGAETYLGGRTTRIQLTVPNSYTPEQREATLRACRLAGLERVELMDQSTAAAIAFALQNPTPSPRTSLLVDLGGGSLDVCLLSLGPDGARVEASAGAAVGGIDWDQRLSEHIWQTLASHSEWCTTPDVRTMRHLRLACEQARQDLSSAEQVPVSVRLPSCVTGKATYVLTRSEMEAKCEDLYNQVLHTVEHALHEAHQDPDQVDEIVLLGGASRMKRVQQLLSDKFPGRPLRTPDEAEYMSVYGAAVESAILDGVTTHLDHPLHRAAGTSTCGAHHACASHHTHSHTHEAHM